MPLSNLGCDQHNLENFLSNFKWSGHRLANEITDGWSTASHKRTMALLQAPTGTLLFYYRDIKPEIVNTLLLEEYGVSKKWVIIMDRRQDSNVTSTPSGKSGPSAQDRYCQRFRRKREETAWNRRKIDTSILILIVMLHVLTYVVSYKLFWD